MTTTMPARDLDRLSRSGLTAADLDNLDDDLRGHAAYDRVGEEIGTVEDVLVDTLLLRAPFVVVSWGGLLGLGKQQRLIPMEAVDRVTPDGVYLNTDKEIVTNAPPHQESLSGAEAELHYREVYNAFGVTPPAPVNQPTV